MLSGKVPQPGSLWLSVLQRYPGRVSWSHCVLTQLSIMQAPWCRWVHACVYCMLGAMRSLASHMLTMLLQLPQIAPGAMHFIAFAARVCKPMLLSTSPLTLSIP